MKSILQAIAVSSSILCFAGESVSQSLPEGINTKVLSDTVLQVETDIAVSPVNPFIIVCTAVTDIYPGGYTTGAYVSTNGGANWSGKNAIKTQQNAIISTVGNPAVTIDKDGTFIVTYIAPTNNINGSGLKTGVSYSTNNGLYWSPTVYVPGVVAADKCTITSDNSPLSPYYGRSYIVYSEQSGIHFSYTTNHGAAWSNIKKISPPASNSRVGASIAVNSSGTIFVSWPYMPSTPQSVGLAISTDGGQTWDSTDSAFPVYPVPYDFRFSLNSVKLNGLPVIAVDNSGGPRDGWLYVASSEKSDANSPALDNCDIVIHRSTDNGQTWSEKFLVNESFSGILKYQFFPAINVDKTGNVNISYYDSRNSPANDSFQVFMSQSVNGGASFTHQLLSNHKFKIKALSADKRLFGIPWYVGSSAGITSAGNYIWASWFDNQNEEYQAWVGLKKNPSLINVKVIPQGFYNINTSRLNSKDTIKAYLKNSVAPFESVDSATGVIDSVTFESSLKFYNAPQGNYYLDVIQRNSIETYSRNPISFSQIENTQYDFTEDSSRAFGNNMVQIGDLWCIFGSDINRDGLVDLTDITLIFNDASEFLSGYRQTDVDGDRNIDLSDLLIAYNNGFNFVTSVIP